LPYRKGVRALIPREKKRRVRDREAAGPVPILSVRKKESRGTYFSWWKRRKEGGGSKERAGTILLGAHTAVLVLRDEKGNGGKRDLNKKKGRKGRGKREGGKGKKGGMPSRPSVTARASPAAL